MGKKIFILLLFLCLIPNVVSAATYKEYKIGDEVTINNTKWYVVEDSNSTNSKLVLLRDKSYGISNMEEVTEYCEQYLPEPSDDEFKALTSDEEDYFSQYQEAYKCLGEYANFCDPSVDENCMDLSASFDNSLDYPLTYDIESISNIGYMMESMVKPIIQGETGLENFTVGLLNIEQYINILTLGNEKLGTSLKAELEVYRTEYCERPRSLSTDGREYTTDESDISQLVLPESISSWLLSSQYWWIDSTYYTGGCYEAMTSVAEADMGYVELVDGNDVRLIRPVIVIEKEPVATEGVPDTSDSIMLYIGLFSISLISTIIVLGNKKRSLV